MDISSSHVFVLVLTRSTSARAAPFAPVGAELAKTNDVRRVAFVLVLILVAAFAAAMRQTPPPLPECVLTIDEGVHLYLERPDDRQHLSDELDRIDLIADRFRERIRADPPVTSTLHALRTHATRPDRAYEYCRTILREQLAKAHAVGVADMPSLAHTDRAQR